MAQTMRAYTTKLRDDVMAREEASKAGRDVPPAATRPEAPPPLAAPPPLVTPTPAPDTATPAPDTATPVPDMPTPTPAPAVANNQVARLRTNDLDMMGTPKLTPQEPTPVAPAPRPTGPVAVPRIPDVSVEPSTAPDDGVMALPHASQPRQRPVTPRLTLGVIDGSDPAARGPLTAPREGTKLAVASPQSPDQLKPSPPKDSKPSSSGPRTRVVPASPASSPTAAARNGSLPVTPTQALAPPFRPGVIAAAVADAPQSTMDGAGANTTPEVPDNALALVWTLGERLQLLGYAELFCDEYMKGDVAPLPALEFLFPAPGAWDRRLCGSCMRALLYCVHVNVQWLACAFVRLVYVFPMCSRVMCVRVCMCVRVYVHACGCVSKGICLPYDRSCVLLWRSDCKVKLQPVPSLCAFEPLVDGACGVRHRLRWARRPQVLLTTNHRIRNRCVTRVTADACVE